VKRRCRLARASFDAGIVAKYELSTLVDGVPFSAPLKVSVSGDRKDGNRSSSIRPLREFWKAIIAVEAMGALLLAT
jgi:hypothetical protein